MSKNQSITEGQTLIGPLFNEPLRVEHVELSLTELVQRADDEIGRASEEIQSGTGPRSGKVCVA